MGFKNLIGCGAWEPGYAWGAGLMSVEGKEREQILTVRGRTRPKGGGLGEFGRVEVASRKIERVAISNEHEKEDHRREGVQQELQLIAATAAATRGGFHTRLGLTKRNWRAVKCVSHLGLGGVC